MLTCAKIHKVIEQFKANNVLLERETGGLKEQLRILERSIIQIQTTEHEVTRKNEELDKSMEMEGITACIINHDSN